MFTGLVEAVGSIAAATETDRGRLIRINAPFAAEIARGDSVAVDGVCLTAVSTGQEYFEAEAIGTTISRTTVGDWGSGRLVNLERSLRVGDRIGGHFVQGHIDGIGTITAIQTAGDHVLVDVELPDEAAPLTVLHGSIAIDGVSLTVNRLDGATAQVALIPHTWAHTNLHRLRTGDSVNVEGDMLGRFVVDQLRRRGQSGV